MIWLIAIAVETLILLAHDGSAQQLKRKFPLNALYIEFLGSGLVLTANYDYRLDDQSGLRIGAGMIPLFEHGSATIFVIVGQSYLLFPLSEASSIEIGGGIGIASTPSTPYSALPGFYVPFHVGYRYQPTTSGLIFRVGLTPLIGIVAAETPDVSRLILRVGPLGIVPWGGLSLGWSW